MKSTPFNPETDLAPMPFSDDVCRAAREMKAKGLKWRPHVGCFVWDEQKIIEVSSPFPNRIYFILNLGHFLKRFETTDNIADKLVWLPTWHQAKEVARKLGVSDDQIWQCVQKAILQGPEHDLITLYQLIAEKLESSDENR